MRLANPIFLLMLGICISLSAAEGAGETAATPSAEHPSTYEARGVLQGVDAHNHQAVIAHEEIPGYMPAMTMSFEVSDSTALSGLQPGDTLTFRLCVTTQRAWIEQLRKTAYQPAQPPFAPAAPEVPRELRVGDFLLDVEFVNQRGEKIRLRDFRGKALAITFIYTSCPLPTYCPLVNRNFQTAQTLLARLGAGENWQFLSVSLDPEHDTPAVLATFAEAYQADAHHWSFVTSSDDSLHRIGAAVGLEFNVSRGVLVHNLRTVVVDAAGRVRKVFRGNEWTPQELVAEVRSALSSSR